MIANVFGFFNLIVAHRAEFEMSYSYNPSFQSQGTNLKEHVVVNRLITF